MKLISYKKYIFKPIFLNFINNCCYINGFLLTESIKFKVNALKFSSNNQIFISKKYFRTFFSLLLRSIDGVSYGFKGILKLKGKGLRLQLKKINNNLLIYLKLGYSHKIFYRLPLNFWVYIYERRRSLILYSLNYSELRTVLLKIRNYYPVNLYKIRGFYEPSEIIKQKKGNLGLVPGLIISKTMFNLDIKKNKFTKKIIYYKNIKKKKLKIFSSIFIKAGIIELK